ncbi:hypothetical protein [Frateuria defendens]|uniref:hypothetical protein n=1 Tax=Frateuria defendens TaxID=2219559 RepID=UPI001293F6AC|nr:hypothetical protein [Frateuria defendens]
MSVAAQPAQLADELLRNLRPHRPATWSARSLGLDGDAFDRLAARLLELDARGEIAISATVRDAAAAHRLNSVSFTRLA